MLQLCKSHLVIHGKKALKPDRQVQMFQLGQKSGEKDKKF